MVENYSKDAPSKREIDLCKGFVLAGGLPKLEGKFLAHHRVIRERINRTKLEKNMFQHQSLDSHKTPQKTYLLPRKATLSSIGRRPELEFLDQSVICINQKEDIQEVSLPDKTRIHTLGEHQSSRGRRSALSRRTKLSQRYSNKDTDTDNSQSGQAPIFSIKLMKAIARNQVDSMSSMDKSSRTTLTHPQTQAISKKQRDYTQHENNIFKFDMKPTDVNLQSLQPKTDNNTRQGQNNNFSKMQNPFFKDDSSKKTKQSLQFLLFSNPELICKGELVDDEEDKLIRASQETQDSDCNPRPRKTSAITPWN